MIKAREKQNGEKTMMVATVKFKGIIKAKSFIPKKEKRRKGVWERKPKNSGALFLFASDWVLMQIHHIDSPSFFFFC